MNTCRSVTRLVNQPLSWSDSSYLPSALTINFLQRRRELLKISNRGVMVLVRRFVDVAWKCVYHQGRSQVFVWEVQLSGR